MNNMHRPPLLGESLNRLSGYLRSPLSGRPPKTTAQSAVTIALGREVGTPAAEIAHEVGARLGWKAYDHELLETMAHDLGCNVRLLESFDERYRNWLLNCLETFVSNPAVTESQYLHRLIVTIHQLAEQGNCVIVGRGAPLMLPARTTVRVRLMGMPRDRAAAISRQHGLEREAALRQMQQLDRERTEFIAKHFHKDPADPKNYDLVINSSIWSIPDCAELILQALQLKRRALADQEGTSNTVESGRLAVT